MLNVVALCPPDPDTTCGMDIKATHVSMLVNQTSLTLYCPNHHWGLSSLIPNFCGYFSFVWPLFLFVGTFPFSGDFHNERFYDSDKESVSEPSGFFSEQRWKSLERKPCLKEWWP